VIGGASLANPLLGMHVLGLGEGILHLSLVLFTFFFLINEMTQHSCIVREKKIYDSDFKKNYCIALPGNCLSALFSA
jgi:hypothetical protein